jgi:hypothetical protein
MALLSLNCSSSLTDRHNASRRLPLLLRGQVGSGDRSSRGQGDPWAGSGVERHVSWPRRQRRGAHDGVEDGYGLAHVRIEEQT